jgi:hypothetical protein
VIAVRKSFRRKPNHHLAMNLPTGAPNNSVTYNVQPSGTRNVAGTQARPQCRAQPVVAAQHFRRMPSRWSSPEIPASNRVVVARPVQLLDDDMYVLTIVPALWSPYSSTMSGFVKMRPLVTSGLAHVSNTHPASMHGTPSGSNCRSIAGFPIPAPKMHRSTQSTN